MLTASSSEIERFLKRPIQLPDSARDWRPEDGGQLELWSTDASRCEVVVEPLFHRTILFDVADKNYHGVRPVEREGAERKSFAIYFHTVGFGDGQAAPHNSMYAPTFYRKRSEMRRIVQDCIPPLLLRGANARQVDNPQPVEGISATKPQHFAHDGVFLSSSFRA